MRAIHRKLIRDLWALRGQAIAVAAVIACIFALKREHKATDPKHAAIAAPCQN